MNAGSDAPKGALAAAAGVGACAGAPAACPRFSIVICNYDYARFVAEAVASALAQDYPPDCMQVVLVDDGSNDDSVARCAQFLGDPRFVLVTQPNRGQSAAFEAGVLAADGDYVCLLDSDDLCLPHKLRRLAAHIATLEVSREDIFLCHDLEVRDARDGRSDALESSWFEVLGIDRTQTQRTLDAEAHHFPFAVPAGLVFARPLIAQCLEALPTWAFPRGTDSVLCPMAWIRTGCVHYLHERLAVYRVHGANEFADIVGGRYTPRFDSTARTPRTLQMLERWIDLLALAPEPRSQALGWLMRFEHLRRQSSLRHRAAAPGVLVVQAVPTVPAGPGVLPTPDVPAVTDSAAVSVRCAQSHTPVEFLALPTTGPSELAWMAEAWQRDPFCEYVVFLRPGDGIDRHFAERHLRWRQHGALVGVSCCDVRLLSPQGTLVHDSVFRNAGAWKQPLQPVPPLTTSLRDWVAPPPAACLFRRTALLDALMRDLDHIPVPLQQAGFWLLFQFQLHTAGALRIRETLASCTLPDGAAATYAYLSAPSGANGRLLEPPLGLAARWLSEFHAREQVLFRQWLPAAWHARFGPWLAAQGV
jgi:hypothetical protein